MINFEKWKAIYFPDDIFKGYPENIARDAWNDVLDFAAETCLKESDTQKNNLLKGENSDTFTAELRQQLAAMHAQSACKICSGKLRDRKVIEENKN